MDDNEILQEDTYTETGEPEQEQTDTKPVIYVGPNVIAFALMRYQVMRGGLPPYVKRAIEKIPEIQELIVPVSELEAARQKIDRPGTNESRLFDSIQQDAKKYNTEYRKSLRRGRR